MSKLQNLKTIFVLMMLFVALYNYAIAENLETIGRWYDNSPSVAGGTIEIYKESGFFYIFRQFRDGSSLTQGILKKTSKGKTIYRLKDRPGDFFVITKDNYLESWDNHGLIYTASPIK